MDYLMALSCNRNLTQAYLELATLRRPGDCYYAWLERFYTTLVPDTLIEIGVSQGASSK